MRILVVEDEEGIARFVKQGLVEESYAVDVAYDGKKGLELAMSGEYDLLLLDWMLPGLSGIEICRQFRKEYSTPVIFLTAKDTVDETIFGLQTGANDYIKKPFHFDELLERVRVQLRPKETSTTIILSAGDIELDQKSHKVTKSGRDVELTLKEFALLEYLLVNKGNVCRRTRIIESVWDIHFEYNTGVIDVNINSLRNKLQLQNNELIKTVRGIGYIIND
ncbi:MAG: DNA-binding response regulator [Marinilabiliales bacterium]|nr:MAG: DNA-binding response regulator [Marinilabiliales bacterium]